MAKPALILIPIYCNIVTLSLNAREVLTPALWCPGTLDGESVTREELCNLSQTTSHQHLVSSQVGVHNITLWSDGQWRGLFNIEFYWTNHLQIWDHKISCLLTKVKRNNLFTDTILWINKTHSLSYFPLSWQGKGGMRARSAEYDRQPIHK